MNNNDLFHRPLWVITRSIGDKTVLFHADEGEVYTLEGSGAQVWSWIAERPEFAFGELLAAMQARFEAPVEVMAGELGQLLEDLLHEGLIHPGSGQGCQ